MVVSMFKCIIELPESSSLKDKRRVIRSLKEKLIKKYKLSVSEVDLQNSLTYAQLGAALVSNSRTYGESVLAKAVDFIEQEGFGRLHDYSILSEFY